MDRARPLAACLLALTVALGCAGVSREPVEDPLANLPPATRARVTLLPLAGPVAAPAAEISAMFWHGDTLVLVPQFPETFAPGDGATFFALDRQEIAAALADTATAGGPATLTPRPVPVTAPGLAERLPGWDGLEAAVCDGDTVYFAVEARVGGRMTGYLLRGRIAADAAGPRVTVQTEKVVEIPQPANIANMTQEALLLHGDEVMVLYEAYGPGVNAQPSAAVFGRDLAFRHTCICAPLEYRVTDATDLDAAGRFWIINYYWPGDEAALAPARAPAGPVEQLVELQLRDDAIVPSGRPVLDLRDDPGAAARNWEAIVRLDGGFLLMTDTYPTTLLAHVAPPPERAPAGKDRP